jgi:transglutaminase-like putative cysteine protease
LDLKTGLDFYPGPFLFLLLFVFYIMRIALSIILSLLFSLQLSALPTVRSGTLPAWLHAINPDLDKKPAPDEISDGYYYQLLDQQTNLAGKTRYTHYIINIANESGVQNASEVSVTFAPEFQQVLFHRINIIRNGATLNRLDLSRIKVVEEEKESDEFEYNGLKRAFLTLKDVRKGDRIEVAYSVIGFNPVFGNKYSDDFSFNTATAVCNYYKTILTTTDRLLRILPVNDAPAPAELHQGNTIIYSWTNPPLRSYDTDADVPSWFDKSPTIYITEYKNWAEVIDWGIKTFNNYQFSLPAPLLQKIDTWRQLAKDDKDRFANIANRFVQNEIRYLGLEIGVNTHRPHDPADVFNQRFGDCKDKAFLLTAILRQEGIPASIALVSTDTRGKLSDIAPSPRDFDHAIVAIRRSKGAYTYIDPTNAGQRGELADLFIPAYGYALVLNQEETGLVTVTPGRINDYAVTERLIAKYFDSSRFDVTSVYTGGAADDIRSSYAENSLRDIEDRYRKYYASLFEGIRQTSPVTYTDDSLRNQFTVREQYTIPQLWNTDKKGKKYFEFSARLIDQALPDPADAGDGEPLALDFPSNVRYNLHLTLPEDWDFGSGDLHIKNDSYQFDFTPVVNGNEMFLTYSLKTFRDNIPAKDVRQYKEDYKNMLGKISLQLYKTITADGAAPEETPASKSTITSPALSHTWKLCWPAVWLTFFFSLFYSRLFIWLNGRAEMTLYAPGTGYPLGGWVTLLGISIGINLFIEGLNLFRENYYSLNNWTIFGNTGGLNLQYLFLSELALHLSFIAGGATVLFWFVRKRDIFPRMFLWYIGILLSGRLLLILLYTFIPVPSVLNTYKYELTGHFIRTLLYAAICVTYVLRSGQIKSTFLEPFRERLR